MRSVIALVVFAVAAKGQVSPALRRSAYVAPLSQPRLPSSLSGFPSPNTVRNPYTDSGSAERGSGFVVQAGDNTSPLYQTFDKVLTKPPSQPEWYKIGEDGNCIEAIVNIVPFSFEYVTMLFGGFKQGTCASQGYGVSAGTIRTSVPQLGETEVPVYKQGGASMDLFTQMPSNIGTVLVAGLISFFVGCRVTYVAFFAVLRLRRSSSTGMKESLLA